MKNLFKINKCKYFLKIQLSIFLHVTTCLLSNERKQAYKWKDGHLNYQRRKQYYPSNFIFRNVHVACKRNQI